MDVIFGEGDPLSLPSLPVVAAPQVGGMVEPKHTDIDDEDPPVLPSNMPVYSKHIKALTDRDYEAAATLAWTRALSRWLAIIQSSSYESAVGKHVELLLEKKDRESALQDLQSFIRYLGDDGWWPLDEVDLLNYLGHCEKKEKSKLTGKNLKHALKFFRHVMGAHFEEEDVLGPVFTGKASRIGATKEARSQARALTVEEVLKLEEIVVKGQNTIDRYFAGCLLFCLYSRARWSDIARTGLNGMWPRWTTMSLCSWRPALGSPRLLPWKRRRRYGCRSLGPYPWGMAWKEVLVDLGFNLMHTLYGPICRAPVETSRRGRSPLMRLQVC